MVFSDAAVSVEHEKFKFGVGVVVLDHSGQCIAACSEPLRSVVSPELAEAMALRRAAMLVREESYTDVVFNSDCLSVV